MVKALPAISNPTEEDALSLIAAMSANGTSRIANIAQIDRGYEDIENRLNALGAKITRVED